jgi:hypothetical protein
MGQLGKLGSSKIGKMGFFRLTHLFRTHFRLERWVFQKMGKKGSKDGFYKWERWVWSRKFFLELMLTQNLKEIFVYNDFYVSLWS